MSDTKQLHPEPVGEQADYGIVTALRDELTALRAVLGATEEVQLGDRDIRYYYRSRMQCQDGSEVVVVCACANDMGQKPALNLTRDLIAAWRPRHLLLAGIAGGFPGRGASYGDLIAPPGALLRAGQAGASGHRTSRERSAAKSTPSRWGISLCKSLNALGLQPRQRRNRVGQSFHLWYEVGTGNLYAGGSARGLWDGPNPYQYAAGSPTTTFDSTGLSVFICTRKTVWGHFNHAYFWADRDGLPPDERSCGRGNFGPELGPVSPELPAGLGDNCRAPGGPLGG